MAQTGGTFDALRDNVKKTVGEMIAPTRITERMTPAPKLRGESTPGLMRTRNLLRGIRTSSIPKGHPKRG